MESFSVFSTAQLAKSKLEDAFSCLFPEEAETDVCPRINQGETGPINSIKLFNSHTQMQ